MVELFSKRLLLLIEFNACIRVVSSRVNRLMFLTGINIELEGKSEYFK